jgi:hypothetical protein
MDWWSDCSSTAIPVGSIVHVVDLARVCASMLLEYSCIWREHGTERSSIDGKKLQQSSLSGSGTNLSQASSMQTSSGSKLPSSKRPSDDDNDDRPLQRRKHGPSSEPRKCQLLVCPFAKNNPTKHCKCYKRIIQEISRLKYALTYLSLLKGISVAHSLIDSTC